MSKNSCIEPEGMGAIAGKAAELTAWMANNAPNCEREQKHLDEGSVERAYWHYGYLCALKDVIALIQLSPESSE
jgi:hypothetical protein